MEDIPAHLDFEYLQLLRQIKPHVTCIINARYIEQIKKWLEKLSDETISDKRLRNSYLMRLRKQIEAGILEAPFTNPPPAGALIECPSEEETFYAAKEQLSSEEQSDKQRPILLPPPSPSTVHAEVAVQHLPPVGETAAVTSKAPQASGDSGNVEEAGARKSIDVLHTHLATAMQKNVDLQKRIQALRDTVDPSAMASCSTAAESAAPKKVIVSRLKHESNQTHRCVRTSELEAACRHYQKKYRDLKRKLDTLHEWYKKKQAESEKKQAEMYEDKLREMEERHDEFEHQRQAQYEAEIAIYEERLAEVQVVMAKRSADEEFNEIRARELQAAYDRQMGELRNKLEKQRNDADAKHRKLEQQCAEAQRQRGQYKKESETLAVEAKLLRQKLDDRETVLKKLDKETCYQLCEQFDKERTRFQAEARMEEARHRDALESERQKCADRIEAQQKHVDKVQDQIAKERLIHEASIASLRKQIVLQRARYRAKLEDRCNNLQEKLDVAREEHLAFVADTQREHERALAELRTKHQMEMDAKLLEQQRLELQLHAESARLSSEMTRMQVEMASQRNRNAAHLVEEIDRLKQHIEALADLLRSTEIQLLRRVGKIQLENQLRRKKQEVLMSIQRVNLIAATTERRHKEFEHIITNLEKRYIRLVEEQHDYCMKKRSEFLIQIHKLQNELQVPKLLEHIA